MSKGLRFKTRCWAYNDEDVYEEQKAYLSKKFKKFNETLIQKTTIETINSLSNARSRPLIDRGMSTDNEIKGRKKKSAPKLLLSPPTSSWQRSRRVTVFRTGKSEKENYMEKVTEEDELNSLVSSKISITSSDYQIN